MNDRFSINIDNSINSGQVFLWEKNGLDWYGVNGQDILKINKNGTIKSILNSKTDFFRKNDNMQEIIKSISKIQGKKGKVYNLASGNSISVKDLAELMISISKKDLDLNYTKPRDGDLLHSEASIQLAKDELEFQPETSLEKGLSNLINE